MQINVVNPAHVSASVMAEALRPSPPVDFKAWASENIVFDGGGSALPGPYDRQQFPFFDEVLDALGPDDPARVVTLSKSAQVGATTLANIYLMGTMALDPCHFLYTHPTEDNARRWSKLKLASMIKSTPAMRSIFPDRTRDQAESVLYKETSDGRGAILASGANSPASLSQVSMRRQVQDDLAKWEVNSAGEPEKQADTRSQAFEFAKIFKIGTPLVSPGCKISRNFDAGSRERYHVPCPHCAAPQVLEWENFKATIKADDPEAAHFTCVSCSGPILERHRPQFNRAGRWIAENTGAKRYHRSFHIWSAYSPLMSFARIARDWIEAEGKPDLEKVFLNDVAGLAFEAQGEAPKHEGLVKRAALSFTGRGIIPDGFCLLTIGVDCQNDSTHWQAVAWSFDGRRAVVDKDELMGNIADEFVRRDLDRLLNRQFVHVNGRRFAADMLAIDGNAYTPDVWDWVVRKPASRVIMVRGVDGEDRTVFIEKVAKQVDRNGRKIPWSKRFYNFSTSVMKLLLYKGLGENDPIKPGYVHFPCDLPDEYFEELTAERRVLKKNKAGFPVYGWDLPQGRRNECLDTMLQAEAAAHKLGLRTMPGALKERIMAERNTPPDLAQMDFEDMPFGGVHAKDAPAPVEQAIEEAARQVEAPTAAPPRPRMSIADMARRMNSRNSA